RLWPDRTGDFTATCRVRGKRHGRQSKRPDEENRSGWGRGARIGRKAAGPAAGSTYRGPLSSRDGRDEGTSRERTDCTPAGGELSGQCWPRDNAGRGGPDRGTRERETGRRGPRCLRDRAAWQEQSAVEPAKRDPDSS